MRKGTREINYNLGTHGTTIFSGDGVTGFLYYYIQREFV